MRWGYDQTNGCRHVGEDGAVSDTKHTEGPWERVDTADYAEIHPKGHRGKSAIALVAKPSDADLIAAAPDLLTAAKRFFILEVETCNCDACTGWARDLKAAISRAEGR